MRNIILNLAVSLDGFIEGPNGETDWCIMDDDMGFTDFLDTVDTIFYGRVSYDAWGQYQPDEQSNDMEKEIWKTVHSKAKYVFTRKPGDDLHVNYISTHIVEQVRAIQQQPGRDIWLYGGRSLINSFIHSDLINVFRLSYHPVVLGGGLPLMGQLQNRINLRHIKTNVFRSGVVELMYEKPIN